MDANELRRAFAGFFAARGHTVVPSASLLPHDATVLFTVAGMVPFVPYFKGDEVPPYARAVSVQKCVRAGGKHNDIDAIGTTTRHLTFFEMLGNFSFGDYFKAGAIPWAWELVTDVLGLDPSRLWVTVHTTDDDAEAIWRDEVGVPAERIQRLGEDNWWSMGDVGPCGPCSEIFWDKGDAYGPPGGPAHGGDERFVEIWNLVFMQFDRQADGSLVELPKQSIDTGAGLERILTILQGTDSVFDTDVLRPLVATAEEVTGRRYGDDEGTDVSLRILADHARTAAFLISDGVTPSNEARGYVLRRIIRRAVRRAYQMGVERPVMAPLVASVAAVMSEAYPDLARNAGLVADAVAREEERFRTTLAAGSAILDAAMAGGGTVGGDVAFQLHDTFGFPVELTKEIAAERGVEVDAAGFEARMAEQRERAKDDRKGKAKGGDGVEAYRDVLERFSTTDFTGYTLDENPARVLAVVPVGGGGGGGGDDGDEVEVFLDRTPFYAEAGGQVGDTGTIRTETGLARVVDTTYALPGLHRHRARVVEGTVQPGQEALAAIDGVRRSAIRRNHTGTHLLHWALREVLGPHVKQAGSLVAPDRLRFDFSHHAAVSPDQVAEVVARANAEVLTDDPVRTLETSKAEADALGAIAFFGDKYADFVRVVEAGHSRELCGGTHVHALGMIGPIAVVSEGSIGSNVRRIEALTGPATLERIVAEEALLRRAAELLRTAQVEEVPGAIERLQARQRGLESELKALAAQAARAEAASLAASAADGVVVARRDGVPADRLRDLAASVRDEPGVRAAVLVGSPDGARVSLVAAVAKGSGLVASELIAEAARTVGGGGGRQPDLAVAGGKDPTRIDEALAQVRAKLSGEQSPRPSGEQSATAGRA